MRVRASGSLFLAPNLARRIGIALPASRTGLPARSMRSRYKDVMASTERDQTDDKLTEERDETDSALVMRTASIDDNADVILRHAREQARRVLELARQRADQALASRGALLGSGSPRNTSTMCSSGCGKQTSAIDVAWGWVSTSLAASFSLKAETSRRHGTENAGPS